MADKEALTAEDLRARLYHSLKEKGLVDALKSQLRNKLISELKHAGVSETRVAEPIYSKEGSLLEKAANSVVADHLRRCNYDYSLSVFLPESGNTQEKIFTTRDLLQLLNISPHSRLYTNLASQAAYPKKGFLWQVLCELASLHGLSSKDMSAQTDPVSLPPVTSLEEQFRKLDTHYSSMGDVLKNKMFVEERILNYQHQLDERSRSEVQLEVARFKENELARMRMEEREKNRQDLDKIRKEMERSYQSKMDALAQRERHSSERLKHMEEIQGKETFSQRQQILDEIEAIRQKETGLKRQQEIDTREKSLWEEKIKSSEKIMKEKEDRLRRDQLEYDQKLNDAKNRFRLEEQARYMERSNSLEVRESKVKDDERRLFDELHGIQGVKDEVKQKRSRVNELEAEMIRVRHGAIKSEKDSELLSEKVREMADYQLVREQNAVLRKEIESLKMRNTELQKEAMVGRQKQEELLREMTDRVGKPTPEMYFLQQQIEKLQNQVHQEKVLADHQRRQADTRLQQEVDRNKDLLRKFEEQSLQKDEMGKEVTDLRDQLVDHRQALTNEVYRRPHQQFPRSNSMCDLDSDVPIDSPGPVKTSDIRSQAYPSNLYSTRAPAGRENGNGETTGSDDYSYSSDLVKETKNRLKNLEKEAQNLETQYHHFHQRMTSVHAVMDDPVRINLHSPNRSRVTFQDNLGASPPLAGSRNVTRTSMTSARSDRPLSSTPSRPEHPGPNHFSPRATSPDMLDASMSTVNSDPPQQTNNAEKDGRVGVRNRPLSTDDLEARPGSPSVLIMHGSDGSGNFPSKRISPSGDDGGSKTDGAAATISLDDAWKQPSAVSLDSVWKNKESNTDQRDPEVQEGRNGVQSSAKKDDEPEKRQEEDDGIDPVMKKYMAMVAEKKAKEAEVAKKSVDVWSKGHKQRSPVHSEHEISISEEDKSFEAMGKPGANKSSDEAEDFW